MTWKFPAMFRDEKIHILVVSFLFVAVALFFVTNRDIIRCRNCANSVKGSGDEKPERSDEPWVAFCLVGKARRLELTAASVMDRVINVFPNSDLFFHCPLDQDSYKLSLLNGSRRIASVRIVEQKPMPEAEEEKQVLSVDGGHPMGVQDVLQYFELVEGCPAMILDYQMKNKFEYDWIIRTGVDTYWTAPLSKTVFVPGTYTVPSGMEYGGLNDRFGAGDLNTSWSAMSKLTMLRRVHGSGYRSLRTETFLRAQLEIQNVSFGRFRSHFAP